MLKATDVTVAQFMELNVPISEKSSVQFTEPSSCLMCLLLVVKRTALLVIDVPLSDTMLQRH